jgi:hypothetical protein
MRVTRRQLKRIIKEEKRKVLDERKVRRLVRRSLTEQAFHPMHPAAMPPAAFHPMHPDHLRDAGADMSADPAWQEALRHVGARSLQDVQVLEQAFDDGFDAVAAGFQSMETILDLGALTMELGTLDGDPAALSSAFGNSMLITA